MRPPVAESPKMLEAYNHFIKLGNNRTLTAVARQFEMSESWVNVIAKTFNWWSKAQNWDRKIAGADLDDFAKKLIKSKKENLEIIRGAKIRYAEKLKLKRVDITGSEMNKFMLTEYLTLGGVTERTEDIGLKQIDDALGKILENADIETLKKIVGL